MAIALGHTAEDNRIKFRVGTARRAVHHAESVAIITLSATLVPRVERVRRISRRDATIFLARPRAIFNAFAL